MSAPQGSGFAERPAVVTAMYGAFWIWAVSFFAIYMLQIGEVQAGRDKSATVVEVYLAMGVVVIWCVGMTRLFLMRPDSWLWLVTGFMIGLPLTILSILNRRVLGHDLTWPILESIARYLIALGIIYYVYRLFNDSKKENTKSP